MFELKDKKEGEEIILIMRRHYWVLIKGALKVLIGFLPVILIFWLSLYYQVGFLLFPLFLIWVIVGGTYFSILWYNWYRDLYILTNERIIDIDQKSLFHKSVAETSLEKVQDVTYEIKGVIPTFLNFGDVVVQTAGATAPIKWEEVENPAELQRKIMAAVKDYEIRHKKDISAKELIDLLIEQKEDLKK